MLKKIIGILLLLVVLLPGVFFLMQYIQYRNDKSEYKSFLKPRFEIIEIQVKSISAEKVEVQARVMLRNPLPIGFVANNLQYRLLMENEEVIHNSYEKEVSVRARDTSMIELPLTVASQKLIQVRKTAQQEKQDSVDYEFQSSFQTDLPFFKSFHYDTKVRRPMFQVPHVVLDKTEIDSLNRSGAKLILHTTISNDNDFPLDAEDIAFEVEIGGSKWIKGEKSGRTLIPAHGKAVVNMPLKISFREVGKSLTLLIRKGKNIDYKLVQTFRVNTEKALLKNCKVLLKSQGTIGSLLEAGKKIKHAQ
jgi:LEA14-like dessication related protein